jgi:hypothetical protein
MTNPLPEDNPENLSEALPANAEAGPTETGPVEDRSTASEMLALHMQGRKGANWFYWVAGLSLVNSAVILGGGSIFFVIGLGVTLMADSLAAAISQHHPEAVWIVKGVALAFDVFVAAVLIGFGWLSARRYLALFGVGMALYLVDGLIFLLFQDWLSVAFHGYALFWMWSGFQAFRKLRVLELTQEPEDGSAEPVPVT